MKKALFSFLLLFPGLASAQLLNFSGTLGISRPWEQSIYNPAKEVNFDLKTNRSGVTDLTYSLQCEIDISDKTLSLSVGNAIVGNTFGINIDNEAFRSFAFLKTEHSIRDNFVQIKIMTNPLKDLVIKKGMAHSVTLKTNVGFAVNKMHKPGLVEKGRGFIYENEGRSDTLLLNYGYTFLNKTGVGLLGEIVFNRIKKESGLPSTLFFKIVIHQGLTKLAQGRVDVTFNSIQDSFNFISRGSYAGVTLGFYIARNKGFYQKQQEYFKKLKISG